MRYLKLKGGWGNGGGGARGVVLTDFSTSSPKTSRILALCRFIHQINKPLQVGVFFSFFGRPGEFSFPGEKKIHLPNIYEKKKEVEIIDEMYAVLSSSMLLRHRIN